MVASEEAAAAASVAVVEAVVEVEAAWQLEIPPISTWYPKANHI